jgi:uncharacterized protein YrzB (UPF0473 family)
MNDFFNGEEYERPIVVLTDEDGVEYRYVEEEVLSIGDKRFAVLIPAESDEEDDAFIAKIVADDDGGESYCDPTEEEFAEVLKVYEAAWEEED